MMTLKTAFLLGFRKKLATQCLHFDTIVEALSFIDLTILSVFIKNRLFFCNLGLKIHGFWSFGRHFSTKQSFLYCSVPLMIFTSQNRWIQFWLIHISSTDPLGLICEKFKFSETRFLGFSHKECIAALLPVKAFAASLQSEGNYGGQTEGSNYFFQNAISLLIFGIF